jgi:hypothetical protein
MLIHGSCAARQGDAVLILGAPGSGKSDLLLRLIQRGWRLVADDQVECGEDGRVAAPPALRGLLEVRGLGLFEGLEAEPEAHLRLVATLAPRGAIPRLPHPAAWSDGPGAPVPLIALEPFEGSAPAKLALALDAATGRLRQRAGAFAA